MNKIYRKSFISKLDENQVFVFGSNITGFHGAGAAGWACRGDHRNNWREDQWFLNALKTKPGHRNRVGKWAVLGLAEGFQQGTEGKSYAICTIKKPGLKRSISRKYIYYQLLNLWNFSKRNKQYEFLMTPIGCGYSGYKKEEIKEIFDFLILKHGKPTNIKNIGLLA